MFKLEMIVIGLSLAMSIGAYWRFSCLQHKLHKLFPEIKSLQEKVKEMFQRVEH